VLYCITFFIVRISKLYESDLLRRNCAREKKRARS